MSLIEKHLQGSALILAVAVDRLDALNGAEVLQAILSQLKDQAPRVVLDLDQVGYMSSSGLRTLIQAAKHVSAAAWLALCSVRPPVREIISIAGFESMMPVLLGRTEAAAQW